MEYLEKVQSGDVVLPPLDVSTDELLLNYWLTDFLRFLMTNQFASVMGNCSVAGLLREKQSACVY